MLSKLRNKLDVQKVGKLVKILAISSFLSNKASIEPWLEDSTSTSKRFLNGISEKLFGGLFLPRESW